VSVSELQHSFKELLEFASLTPTYAHSPMVGNDKAVAHPTLAEDAASEI
jgi:hypothetical protein